MDGYIKIEETKPDINEEEPEEGYRKEESG